MDYAFTHTLDIIVAYLKLACLNRKFYETPIHAASFKDIQNIYDEYLFNLIFSLRWFFSSQLIASQLFMIRNFIPAPLTISLSFSLFLFIIWRHTKYKAKYFLWFVLYHNKRRNANQVRKTNNTIRRKNRAEKNWCDISFIKRRGTWSRKLQ